MCFEMVFKLNKNECGLEDMIFWYFEMDFEWYWIFKWYLISKYKYYFEILTTGCI
jgi:hypothetical protein